MKTQIRTMLEMQEAMNAKVNPDWRAANYDWCRAVWIECAELMDHHGWKWWKAQEPDLEQVKLELVDIFHFGLSDGLTYLNSLNDEGYTLETLIDEIEGDYHSDFENLEPVPVLQSVEMLAAHVLTEGTFNFEDFFGIMRSVNMSFEELYKGYVGKNVLNFFRQDNGYKEGTYQKIWDGEEDNVHLVRMMDELDSSALDFKDRLYSALNNRYAQVTMQVI